MEKLRFFFFNFSQLYYCRNFVFFFKFRFLDYNFPTIWILYKYNMYFNLPMVSNRIQVDVKSDENMNYCWVRLKCWIEFWRKSDSYDTTIDVIESNFQRKYSILYNVKFEAECWQVFREYLSDWNKNKTKEIFFFISLSKQYCDENIW